MSEFHQGGMERVNAFLISGQYVFKHFFDEDAVFDELKQYYDTYNYRFEIPTDRLTTVQELLNQNGYALIVVDETESFVVVKRKYTKHPRVLFVDSVIEESAGNFNCFLMKDQESVQKALTEGAIRLSETDIEFSL